MLKSTVSTFILNRRLNSASYFGKRCVFAKEVILTENIIVNKGLVSIVMCFVYLQKWSKGKVRDKLNNLVLFDKGTYEKLYKEVPNYKLITPSVVSERLKVRGSLAKKGLRELYVKGTQTIYTMLN